MTTLGTEFNSSSSVCSVRCMKLLSDEHLALIRGQDTLYRRVDRQQLNKDNNNINLNINININDDDDVCMTVSLLCCRVVMCGGG